MFEYIDQYRSTPFESAVVSFYKQRHIKSPQDIDLEMFADDAGIALRYLPRPSTTVKIHNTYFVIIDDRMPWEQQRVELAHELGHILLHAGRQDFMPNDFKAMQEWQADRFAMYALVPTFMIANCLVQVSSRQQLVSQLAYTFDVPDTFMDARLKLLQERIIAIAMENQTAQLASEQRNGYDYSYRHPLDESVEYLVKDGHVVGTRRRARL